MGRLIDADKFISWLDCGHLREPSEKCLSELNVKQMIDNQPTAYDVDGVVEQLKEAKEKSTEENKNISEEAKAWNEALNEAIFFVKGGGQA